MLPVLFLSDDLAQQGEKLILCNWIWKEGARFTLSPLPADCLEQNESFQGEYNNLQNGVRFVHLRITQGICTFIWNYELINM